MGHELIPKEGQPYLEPEEIVRRLRAAFKYVDADINRGTASLEHEIQYMIRTREVFSDEQIEKARRAKGTAVDIIIADEPEPTSAYLNFLVLPDEKLFVGYESYAHETSARPLLERLAKVLDYNIELV